MKLYDVEHPYYCTKDHFFSKGKGDYQTHFEAESFDYFLEKCETLDNDWNYLIRWDWKKAENKGEKDTLCLFYYLQRKGYLMTIDVKVTKDDESRVKKFLTEKADYIKLMWCPLL